MYPSYMQMMHAWCIQIYQLNWTFIHVVVKKNMVLWTVEFPVFCAAVQFGTGKPVIYFSKKYDSAISSWTSLGLNMRILLVFVGVLFVYNCWHGPDRPT